METFLGLDYPTWWFLVIGGLFSGYAILDGFDFGAGAWHLFFDKKEERRIALNAIGPVWDGNEVWLVIGGGALFAGFPVMYASLFSAMNTPFMLFLTFLIFRAVSIEFRGKEPMQWWRNTWDVCYSISSIFLAFLLGVVLGNILQGLPIDKNFEYQGDALLGFLNPYAILTGLTTLTLFMMHGAIYLLLKTQGKLYLKIQKMLNWGMIAFIVTFLLTTIYTLLFIPHLGQKAFQKVWLMTIPVFTFLSIANVPRLAKKKKYKLAFLFSALTMSFMLMLVAVELYPNLLVTTLSNGQNITIYNAAASVKTLKIMLTIAAIGGPLVLTYTYFVYKVFWGKVEIDEHSY